MQPLTYGGDYRASPTLDAASGASVNKARQAIDQLGDRLFD